MFNNNNYKNIKKIKIFSYYTGFTTASIIFLCFFFVITHRIGFQKLYQMISPKSMNKEYRSRIIDIDDNTLLELKKHKAVLDNCDNPTEQPAHDNFFVSPDKDLQYILRPGVKAYAHILKTGISLNFDPPVLYISKPASKLSPILQKFINEQARLSFTYQTDSSGFRKTLPEIDAEEIVLVVGDSVAFGVGVDDKNTAASFLQSNIGSSSRVINAGVGGYSAEQIYQVSSKLTNIYNFSTLIYIACQNDFKPKHDWTFMPDDIFTRFKSLSDNFGFKVIIVLHTYMEYNFNDIFGQEEYHKFIANLRYLVRNQCEEYDFSFYDWTDLVSNFRNKSKSVFSGFALYADHCHLSPLGNQLLADEIFNFISKENSASNR